MEEQPRHKYSFIIRCWRDDRGQLSGRLIDALSGQARSFTSIRQLSSLLDCLTRPQPSTDPPSPQSDDCGG
jgi:hypothetical protein